MLSRSEVVPLVTEGASIGCFENARFVSAKQSIEPGARLLVFSDGIFEIFLEGEQVQTRGEFLAEFGNAEVAAMNPAARLNHTQALRGAEILEDDFSLLEIRFP